MDEDDTRPLLIDQPEGNLDNSSVYKQLVPYISKAKRRRQIILITHNPNLVVATDAEQIIIATADRPDYPTISVVCGMILGDLEHSVSGDALGVREAVCLLLEGGEEAFKASRESLLARATLDHCAHARRTQNRPGPHPRIRRGDRMDQRVRARKPSGGAGLIRTCRHAETARKNRSLYFDDLLDAKVREFNPKYTEAEGALLGEFQPSPHRHLRQPRIPRRYLRNQGKFFDARGEARAAT